jgi:branched-chain amino acid transport system ATP-binding protein
MTDTSALRNDGDPYVHQSMNAGTLNAPAAGDGILEVSSLSKAFGGLQVLYDISFSVTRGTIHAVIGPNGAGKTTFFNLATGVYTPDSGRILFEKREIQGRRVHELVARGIARTFQNVELFESLSVLENVLVGQYVRTRCGFWGALGRWPWVRREEREARERAMALLEFVGLQDKAEQRSSDLPFGWQRLLEIARALAAQPLLLLLDEPAAGLNAVETQLLGELIQQIKAQGITVLLVEHDMSLTMEISDRLLVLDQGRKLAEGTAKEIQSNEKVMAAYLGKS